MNDLKDISVMTPESAKAFIEYEKSKGASENLLRRLKATLKAVYNFLPDNKQLTKESLLGWRDNMNDQGYAYQTVQNYVKYLNRYLDYVELSEIRFNRGKNKDISNMEFGFITAIEPTNKRQHNDVVWLCRCRCGAILEIPATRLIQNNTLSCGCIQKELIKRTNKYFDGTSLEKSLKNPIKSTRSTSGYVGVTKKKDKWQAYITYKRKHISLGVYDKLEDAVMARAKGKEAVMEDAAELLKIYEEIHKNDEMLPNKLSESRKNIFYDQRVINDQPATWAKRVDNTSGYTGISFRNNKWEARICHNKVRYMLGRFDTRDDAIIARKQAEDMLKTDRQAFVKYYSANCKQYEL